MRNNSSKETVLITGANRGMGLGYVKHYLKREITVIATARDIQHSQSLQLLKNDFQETLKIVRLDVTNEASISNFKRWLLLNKIEMSLVINNAGISLEEHFEDWTKTNFVNHFEVNVIGPSLLIQAVLPVLNRGAKIIQITSGMASLEWNINPTNGFDAYAASKNALHSITVRLAEKLKPKAIGLFLINPGWVKTEMGGENATYSINEAITNITAVIRKLTLEQTGSFVSEKGDILPW